MTRRASHLPTWRETALFLAIVLSPVVAALAFFFA